MQLCSIWEQCSPFCVLLLEHPELFGIRDNQVHMLVKSQHLSNELPSIIDSDPEPVVNEASHLGAFLG